METLKFKGWMAEHGVKQKDLAELLGITQENVNAKVNGRLNFTLPQIKLICSTYQISADDFFI